MRLVSRVAAAESLAFAGVAVLATLRFSGGLLAAGHPGDEAHYFEGFARFAAGLDPYALRDVLFPPSFAWMGAHLVTFAGERGAALELRALAILGIAATAWLAAAATERSLRDRFALAALATLLFPPFAHAVFFGNIGPLATGMILASLALVPRRPLAAGALLGISLAVKPIGVALLPLLLFRREPGPSSEDRTRVGSKPGALAAGIAVAIAAVLVLAAGPWLLPRFLARHGEAWLAPFQLGFVRAAAELGLELPTWLPLAAVVALAWMWRKRNVSSPTLLAVAPALAVAAAPIVWLHTLALALPVAMRALLGPHALSTGFARRIELPLRLVLFGAICGAGGAGAIDAWPAPLRAAVAALPLVAVLILAARCLSDADSRAATI